MGFGVLGFWALGFCVCGFNGFGVFEVFGVWIQNSLFPPREKVFAWRKKRIRVAELARRNRVPLKIHQTLEPQNIGL